jgi:hypothetical protein
MLLTHHKNNFLIGIVKGAAQMGPLGIVTANCLLCQPRVIMMMEKLVELFHKGNRSARRKPAPLPHCHHKTHMMHGREPGPPRWEASV